MKTWVGRMAAVPFLAVLLFQFWLPQLSGLHFHHQYAPCQASDLPDSCPSPDCPPTDRDRAPRQHDHHTCPVCHFLFAARTLLASELDVSWARITPCC
jgi:hypothetical protein